MTEYKAEMANLPSRYILNCLKIACLALKNDMPKTASQFLSMASDLLDKHGKDKMTSIEEKKLQFIKITFDDETSYVTKPGEIVNQISADITSLTSGLFKTITLSMIEMTEKEYESLQELSDEGA